MLIITRVLFASKTQTNRLAHNTPSTAKLMANNNSQATLKGDCVVVEQEVKEDLVTRSILQDRTALKNLALGVSMHFLQQICGLYFSILIRFKPYFYRRKRCHAVFCLYHRNGDWQDIAHIVACYSTYSCKLWYHLRRAVYYQSV